MTNTSIQESKGSILVVDDSVDNLRLLATMLTEQAYKVNCARSGSMALISIQTSLPDLILLDIMMPELNGYQFCQQLKANPKTVEVPIIFISALDEVMDKVKAFQVGGADYITKPFQMEEVLARIEHQLTISRLQTRLQAQNQELARSNRELEQFAYVVSHDLKQPLQSFLFSVSLLEAKFKQRLDEGAAQYINNLRETSKSMQKLIEDLLAYARAGKAEQTLEAVDCNTVIEQVLENLKIAITEADAKVSHDPLPTVQANPTQLMQVFQNLVSNAIKFHQPNETPQVKISLEQATPQLARVATTGATSPTNGKHPSPSASDKGKFVFGIHDNGIGLDPQHFEHIFEVFQRIHPGEQYPGNGIGLATCKKIVERHGGQIWVESALGKGTTFYFSLPQPSG